MKKLVLLFACLFLLTSCLDFEEVRFLGVDNVKLPKYQEKEMVFDLSLKIDNPNNYKIKIKPSSLDVSVGGTRIGVVHLDDKVVLLKKQEGIYATRLKLKLDDGVMKTLLKLTLAKDISIRFQGKIKGSVMGFSRKVEIDETKTLDPAILKLLL